MKKVADAWNKASQNSSVFEKAFEDFKKSGYEKVDFFNIGTNLSIKYHLSFVKETGICSCQHYGRQCPCALRLTELIINVGYLFIMRTVSLYQIRFLIYMPHF